MSSNPCEVPYDGVYYRAPGVSENLRSFSIDGPANCYRDSFIKPDVVTNTVPHRAEVPKEFRSWNINYESYDPPDYITMETLSNSRNRNPKGWADPEPSIKISDPSFSHLFKKCNPIWYRGLACDANGNYVHPYGRVGIKGQGTLGGRHVNEAIDPVTVFLDPDTGVVKVLLIKRIATDVNETTWAIPGGMVDFKPETGAYTVPRVLASAYEAYKVMLKTDLYDTAVEEANLKENAMRELNEETGFSGNTVYQKMIAHMYCDDVRNTDTTWIVTSLFLIVPAQCEVVRADGHETSAAAWVPMKEAMGYEFFASHRFMISVTLRYYITNSFHERKMQGSTLHRLAYDYLKNIPELDLPQSFDLLAPTSVSPVKDSTVVKKVKSKSCSVS